MTFIRSIAGALALSLLSSAAMAAVIHKDPRCGCCTGYAQLLRDQGYDVETNDSFDVFLMSVDRGIPGPLQGCHLMEIAGYVVSGHVPLEAIERLLAERPEIDGLTLPGMPMGSPGMGGDQTEPFEILAVSDEGATVSTFMSL